MTKDTDTAFDPPATPAQITTATGRLLRTASRLSDADVRAPSLLPGGSRGHVLTHLARNADGGGGGCCRGRGPEWRLRRVRGGGALPAAPFLC
jgi:hypothetical protein